MIKVGQIFKNKNNNLLFIVTRINQNGNADILYITGVGDCHSMDCWFETEAELIAEYPTWQEAVNSEEFKGDE
ncbi:MAG: hypothetical protein NC124_02570 [Clostridium sp.]|nr:hypothetical protein [Clostridium sp.]